MTLQVLKKEKFAARPKAVLLDLDDTIYAYDGPHKAGMAAVTTKVHTLLSVPADIFGESFGEARRQVKARTGATAASHSRLLYFQRTLELLGLKTQPMLALDLEQTYWRVFMGNMALLSGTKEFLQDLRFMGIVSAIVTDLTAHTQFRKMVMLRIEEMVDFVVSSEEAGSDKPNEAPFKLALEKMRISDGPFWMIGDDHECDGRGARDAIGASVLIRRKCRADADGGQADLLFDDFTDLRQLLEGLPE